MKSKEDLMGFAEVYYIQYIDYNKTGCRKRCFKSFSLKNFKLAQNV